MAHLSSLDLGDDEFLSRFCHGELDRYEFPHRAHLRLAWLAVRRFGVEGAVGVVTGGLRALTEKRGQPGLYHETLTRAWVYAVAAADAGSPTNSGFEAFLEQHPELLDKDFLLRHYTPQRLSSPEARARWLRPDIRPIAGAPLGEDVEQPPRAAPTLAFDAVRRVMDHLPLPVSVMAAHDATHVHGVTVSSVATVARDPAMLVACIRRDSRVLPIVRAAGGFAISYLSAGQSDIAARFADRTRGEEEAQFSGIPHTLGPFGAPIVTGGAAWFECGLLSEVTAGDHQILCGTVLAAGATDNPPLQRLHGSWI